MKGHPSCCNRGGGGELSDCEYLYVRSMLAKDRKLRACWGFPRGRARLSEGLIRYRAMHGFCGH